MWTQQIRNGFRQMLQVRKRWDTPLAGYLFISPWLVGFFLFVMWPMFLSGYYSFTDYSLLSPPRWVGLQNYERIFMDDNTFYQSLKVTLLFVCFAVPSKLVSALLIALLLNKNIKGMSFYRTMIYFPSLIGTSIAVAVLWMNIFGKSGFVNHVIGWFGIEGVSWVSDPDTALGTLVLLNVWQFGSSMVIFLARLKQIPSDLYEASSVDGASKWKQFFSITLPMLSSVVLFNLVLQTIYAFQMFTQALIITKGGPVHATYMFSLYLYERGFGKLEMGYASSLAWILLALIGITTALIFLSSKYWVFYESEGGKES